MPELPEVQTTVADLNKHVNGLVIKSVWSDAPSLIKSMVFKDFVKNVEGRRIENAERRGKNILINLSGGKILRVHLKMTGHFMYGIWHMAHGVWQGEKPETLKDPYNRFVHLMFGLSDGKQLALSDLRKFARVELFSPDEMPKDMGLLGPEPLEKGFTEMAFEKRLKTKPNSKIKQVLMDQTVLSGIGNIYSDEILWEAGIHPMSVVSKIPAEKIRDAYDAMNKILLFAITKGGDSASDYRRIYGQKGEYQNYHRAYRLTGQACRKDDGGKIERIKVGGRSGHFCPKHQKLYK